MDVIFVFCGALILIFGWMYFSQEKLIFLNGNRLDKNYTYKFSHDFEELFLKTEDGNHINALHFKLEKPKGVVLFCHGNSGNLDKWGANVSFFLDFNYEVLVFDYRNYGKVRVILTKKKCILMPYSFTVIFIIYLRKKQL
jgi:pimeloyl-ACP methyl ester carboxylesterase